MIDTKQFNPLPLLSVKAGLDSSLAQISSELEIYFAEGWAGNQHLQIAQDELHRAVGVLQMLSLEGLAVFSKELETVLQEMLAQQQATTSMHSDTLRGAMLALTQYLDALADGASNTVLRLFYSYQELQQLRGLGSALEVDLFFPEFGVELPSEVLDVPLVPAALASVKKARAQYQRALLKWLRQDDPALSLNIMRATVQVLMVCAPQDQNLVFWWAATGLIDCLIHDGLPAELNANKLLARIDLKMKSMVENAQRNTEYNTTCGMQDMLERSQPVSETVDKIKQTYELGACLPETQAEVKVEIQNIVIGGVNLSPVLFNIVTDEAAGVIETLQRLVAALRQSGGQGDEPVASYDFVRAAHTLAGVSRSTGFTDISDLASALEAWLQALLDSTSSLDILQLNLLEQSINALGEMVNTLRSKQEPKARPDLITRLQIKKTQLKIYPEEGTQKDEPSLECISATVAFEPIEELPETEINPFDEDIDLVAYVQRVTQEYASEPLSWESADVPSNSSKDIVKILKSQEVLQDVPVMDLSDLQTATPKLVVEELAEEPFAFNVDDLDEQLLPVFLEEADELYPQLTDKLGAWRDNTDNAEEGLKIARKLQRSLHTLKGSARMAGAMRLGELTHRVEDCLDAAVAAGKQDVALLDELEGFFDRIGDALEKLRSGDAAEEVVESVTLVVGANKSADSGNAELPAEVAEERRDSTVLRVRSDIVDNLVNEAGELSVARSRMEIELSAFKNGLHDLSGSVQGLRKLVREIEMHAEGQMQARSAVARDSAGKFDPLEPDGLTRFQELTRFMNESIHDVQMVQQALLKNLDETSAVMSAQDKLNTGLQKSLMSIRMLPFSSASQRLYRIVRQEAKELGKKVNLELYGTEIELDRGVLEKMTAPFEHLLRNAIVHGLENPEQRELKGKSPIGNIALTLRQEGNEVVFEFKDDGAGLDTGKLRQIGREQGLLLPDEDISDEKVMLLIFETGLSTASELTEISGRGVGMDVVLSEIKALGGRIEVSSEPDKGASFTIYLPLTLAVMKVLTVRAGNDSYAIPSVMVEQVQQVKPASLVELYRKGEAEWQGKSYPMHYLRHLLGDKERTPDSKPHNTILLLRSGEQRMALHLDELLGNKEVVVKNVGIQLARLPGIAGATVQANGKVVLILNPFPLSTGNADVKAGRQTG